MCVTFRLSASIGRCGPCCSIAPPGSPSTRRASAASFTSGQVIACSSGLGATRAPPRDGLAIAVKLGPRPAAASSAAGSAQGGGQDAELLAVLGHAAAGDLDVVLLGQLL